MTIDPPTNWKAAAALERGEDPRRETAQFRLATLLSEHDDIHTIHHHMIVAGRVLAFLPRIQSWADAEQAGKSTPQLRQQPVARADNETWFLEEAKYHLDCYRDAMSALSKMGSVYAKDYDPDAKAQDREDDRAREQRQDDAAREEAPRVAS